MSDSARAQLGEILLRYHLITEKHLREALEVQRRTTGRLGEVLLRMGHLNENELMWSLADQLSLSCVPTIDTRPGQVDPQALQRVPAELAWRYHLVPFLFSGDELIVLTDEPLRSEGIEALEQHAGVRVTVATSPTSQVLEALRTLYGPQELTHAPEDASAASPRLSRDALGAWLQVRLQQGDFRFTLEPAAPDGVPTLKVRRRHLERHPLDAVFYQSLIGALREAAGVETVTHPVLRPFSVNSLHGTIAFALLPSGLTATVRLWGPELMLEFPPAVLLAFSQLLVGDGLWLVAIRDRSLWEAMTFALRRGFAGRQVLGGESGVSWIESEVAPHGGLETMEAWLSLQPDLLIVPGAARGALLSRLRGGLPDFPLVHQVPVEGPQRALQVLRGAGATGAELAEAIRGVLCLTTLMGREARDGVERERPLPVVDCFELTENDRDLIAAGESIPSLFARSPLLPTPLTQLEAYVADAKISRAEADSFLSARLRPSL